jgi:AcrR family transcriptional regulator
VRTLETGPQTRPRDRDRRAKIIAAATRLFRDRGFHAVGIDEIGAAAGITGPGVYRHFSGKDELLVAALGESTEELWADLAGEAPLALEQHVASHVAYAVAHTDVVQLWYQEGRNLPAPARAAQRRLQRRYIERWVDALLDRCPDLNENEARIRVRAAIGLIHSISHSDQARDPRVLRPILERMVLAAILA